MHSIAQNRCRFWIGLTVAILTGLIQEARGQESRFYEEGGITYKEIRTKVQQPVRELEYRDEQQTHYRERYVTDMQPTSQTVYQPAVQYVWEPRWHDWWRVFEGPHLAYHLVPRSTWLPQVVNYQVPVTRREVAPETRTVRVAVPKLSMKEVDSVTRVAVGPAASSTTLAQTPVVPAPGLAWNLTPVVPPSSVYPPSAAGYAYSPYGYGYAYPYGGVARLQSDPPRYGSGLANGASQGAWQARTESTSTR